MCGLDQCREVALHRHLHSSQVTTLQATFVGYV
jgi:hypothetical protein